ncbi:hypothetical protein E2I00_009852, partial [Balaenoptera physalus]
HHLLNFFTGTPSSSRPGFLCHSLCSSLILLASVHVSPLPLPGDGSTVTPATSPNPATLFLPSVRMMKFVASVLNSEVKERKACLPRTQCSLQGHATCWSRSYTPQHHCCEQDLGNAATTPHRPPSLLLITPLILVASFTWGAHLLHQPSTQDSSTITVALETPAQTLLRSAQEPDL